MKIGFSTLTLMGHRQDKPQSLTSTRVNQQKSEPAAAPADDDPFTKRLKKQQEALERLASLPSPKEASQQRAAEKAGFLRQRLEMLKAMMSFASPEQLKNLAKELKSIARELAGAAKLLGNEDGAGTGVTVIPSVVPTAAAQPEVTQASGTDPAAQAGSDEVAQVSAPSNAEADAQTAEEEADKAAQKATNVPEDDENASPGILPSFASPLHNEGNRSKSQDTIASEHSLRGVLADAKKVLEEAVNLLKIRLNEEDKEARRELKKAEKEMEKIDRAIASSTSDALYSALGQMLPTASIGTSVLSTSINVEV